MIKPMRVSFQEHFLHRYSGVWTRAISGTPPPLRPAVAYCVMQVIVPLTLPHDNSRATESRTHVTQSS